MNLHLSLEYITNWGQSVQVELSLTRHSGTNDISLISLNTEDGHLWSGDIHVPDRDILYFEYRYVICADGKIVRREWNGVPRRFPASYSHDFQIPDYWKDIPLLNHLYSSAYTNCVSGFESESPRIVYYDQTLLFRVQAPQLKPGQALAILGSQPPLGAWEPTRALRMQKAGINEWYISLSAIGLYLPFEYKYVVVDESSGDILEWEGGKNRLSPSGVMAQNQVIVIYDQEIRVSCDNWKVAGLVIPVFSLRSEHSQGVGDFSDLRRMVDWARSTGMRAIQLLPIYDTTQTHTWTDSYPYNSISIYALHPMYVDLQQLPPVNDAAYMQTYEKTRRQLNESPQVDYEAVNILKQEYLRKIYKQESKRVLKSDEYQKFLLNNQDWLIPYSVFCLLRDKYGTCDFQSWPRYSKYSESEVSALAQKKANDVNFYIYQQFILDQQLSATSQYARSVGVLLKGDIPIGISRHSVEAWVEPYYFHMNGQAGAPPDDFSVNGQNWGFPTYDWERMAQDGYQWWVRRFRKMAQYFDAYRIDHVLGFFRIWEIPMHSVHGLLGQFSPSMPMSVEEIESYGIAFKESYTEPYITDQVVDKLFGPCAEQVRLLYLVRLPNDQYAMRPEYATQRQVEASFANCTDSQSAMIRDGLYSLISDVLFIPDSHDPTLYHPRIGVMNDFVFHSLSPKEQDAFRTLYEHYYYHRHNDFWYGQAMAKLPALVEATRMLVCAEDLGMVPACVAPVMDRLRMLSLEIQAMPKNPGLRFGRIEENPYRSVSTIFTHDMATLRGWWEEDYDRTQSYYNEVLFHDGAAPRTLPGWIAEEIVARHLFCPSMLCMISLQDWLSIDENLRYANVDEERINIPANPRHYWRYRMHVTIEKLQKEASFNMKVEQMIVRSGR